jgi:hypothetical protein
LSPVGRTELVSPVVSSFPASWLELAMEDLSPQFLGTEIVNLYLIYQLVTRKFPTNFSLRNRVTHYFPMQVPFHMAASLFSLSDQHLPRDLCSDWCCFISGWSRAHDNQFDCYPDWIDQWDLLRSSHYANTYGELRIPQNFKKYTSHDKIKYTFWKSQKKIKPPPPKLIVIHRGTLIRIYQNI